MVVFKPILLPLRGNIKPTMYPITVPDKLFAGRKNVCDPLMPPKN